MAYLRQGPERSKITVDNKYLQQVQLFDFLGCIISYEDEKDIQQELENFAQLLGILNNTFKPTLDQKSSRIKTNNALCLSRPIILCGRNIWTLRKKGHQSRLNFFRKTTGSTIFFTTKE